jgi:hypothetical protein
LGRGRFAAVELEKREREKIRKSESEGGGGGAVVQHRGSRGEMEHAALPENALGMDPKNVVTRLLGMACLREKADVKIYLFWST